MFDRIHLWSQPALGFVLREIFNQRFNLSACNWLVLEKAMAPHSSTLAWKIPWAEEPGRMHAVHGITEGQTQLSDFTFTFHFHALKKEMATHSSVLAWSLPGMAEPGGLLSMGSHRVGHDWSDLAATAAAPILQGFAIVTGLFWFVLFGLVLFYNYLDIRWRIYSLTMFSSFLLSSR